MRGREVRAPLELWAARQLLALPLQPLLLAQALPPPAQRQLPLGLQVQSSQARLWTRSGDSERGELLAVSGVGQ